MNSSKFSPLTKTRASKTKILIRHWHFRFQWTSRLLLKPSPPLLLALSPRLTQFGPILLGTEERSVEAICPKRLPPLQSEFLSRFKTLFSLLSAIPLLQHCVALRMITMKMRNIRDFSKMMSLEGGIAHRESANLLEFWIFIFSSPSLMSWL